jgi:hypothetical protein
MTKKILESLRIFAIASIICLLTLPLSRYISPRAIVNDNDIYLAWLPLSVMLAVILLFGRHAIAPIIVSTALINAWGLHLTLIQSLALLFCQVFSVLVVCGIMRWQLGRRWRFGVPNRNIGIQIFWLGFILPISIKLSMFLIGYLLHFPVMLSNYFGVGSAMDNVIDVQSLISSAIIFTMMFYYPLRMMINPRYAMKIWRYHVRPSFSKKHIFFTLF